MNGIQTERVDGRVRRGEERREAILAATYRLVVRDGLDGIRSATIAAEAGASVGLIHYHYPTLDDLAHAVYGWDEQRVWGPLGELAAAPDPRGVLEQLLPGQLVGDEPSVRAGFVFWQEFARRAVFDEEIRVLVAGRIERWVEVMATLLAAAGTGEEAAQPTAQLLASALFGASTLHLIGLVPMEQASADVRTMLASVLDAAGETRVLREPVRPAVTELPEPNAAEVILDATLAVIARDGVRGVHFPEVSEAAGVSTTLPRYYFPTLHELLAASFARFLERRRARLVRGAEQAAGPIAAIRSAIAGDLARPLTERRGELVIWHEFLRLAFVHEDLRAVVCAAVQEDIDFVAGLIRAAQTQNLVDIAVDAAAAARRVDESVNGIGLGSLLGVIDDEQLGQVLELVLADALRRPV